MRTSSKYLLRCLAVVVGVWSGSEGALSQEDYPSRPVRTVIGFPPGGGADVIIRYVSKRLESVSGKTFVVENKPGGGSNIAASLVASAKPDGYTLLYASNSAMVGGRFFQKDISYDTVRDFAPVASFVEGTFFIAVSADSPIKTMPELLAYLRSRPQNRFSYASNLQLLAAKFFTAKAAINATPVAYRGSTESIPDLTGGSLEFSVIDFTVGMGLIRAGKIRAIASTAATRYPGIDVPLLKEVGFEGADFAAWWALYAPKATPAPIVDKLAGWMKQVTTSPETAEYFGSISNITLNDDGPATMKRVEREIVMWGSLVKEAGIEPQ